MKLNTYSIFDQASGLYSRPFFTQSDGEAIRHFSDIATDAEHPVGMHPADYTLFRIGIYDDTKALLINEENQNLGNALEMCANARNVNKDNLDLFDKEITLKQAREKLQADTEKLNNEDLTQSYGGTD